MHRRRILAGVAVTGALGGCLGDGMPEESEFSCDSGDADEPIDIGGYPDTDTPPHSIRPQDDVEEWNDHYLGECMDREPSLPFEEVDVDFTASLADEARLSHDASHWVQLATNPDEEARFWATRPASLREFDYKEECFVLIQSGHHSGSLWHNWVRVEEATDGFHLHGYHREPKNAQADGSVKHSAVAVKQVADDDDNAIVSLTWDTETRYHFTSENGEVSHGNWRDVIKENQLS